MGTWHEHAESVSNLPHRPDRLARVFVWCVWTVMFVAALWFAGEYGNPVPFIDEWRYVPILTGEEPITIEWLWQPHGEHRIPLAKLVWATLIKQTRSFKVGAFVNVVLIGLLAFMLLRAAQSLRGGLRFTDAVIPMLLLHFGQGYNLQWWWQSTNLPSLLLVGFVLVAVVRGGPHLREKWALAAGACLMVLPFCGPSALPCTLAMSVWLGAWGIRSIRTNATASRWTGRAAFAMAVAAAAFVCLYFVRLEKPEHMPPSPGIKPTLRTAFQFLSVSVGAGASQMWKVKAVAISAFLTASCLKLAVAWYRLPVARFRISGLLLITGAVFPLALSLGWGRAYNGVSAGLSHWYVIFGVPALLSGYFAWRLYAPAPWGQIVRVAALVGTCVMLALNLTWTQRHMVDHHRLMTEFVRDLNAGLPLPALADRYSSFVTSDDSAPFCLEPLLQQLYDAGYPALQPLNSPRLIEPPLFFTFKRSHEATWSDGVLTGTGADSYVDFALEAPHNVYAVRVIFFYEDSQNPATCSFYWRCSRKNDFGFEDRLATWQQNTSHKPCTRAILIDDVIDEIRIYPASGPSTIRFELLIVLIKEDGPTSATASGTSPGRAISHQVPRSLE